MFETQHIPCTAWSTIGENYGTILKPGGFSILVGYVVLFGLRFRSDLADVNTEIVSIRNT